MAEPDGVADLDGEAAEPLGVQQHQNSNGEPCGCGQTPPQSDLVHHVPANYAEQRALLDESLKNIPARLIRPDDRDRLAATDQGQYYCVGADTGVLVAREGRPVYATLAEWHSFANALPGAVYVPITGAKGPHRLGPLLGSMPLIDMQGAPDITGRVIEVLSFLEKAAEATTQRVSTLDEVVQRIANRPTHERELLRRAAAMIDEDVKPPTYEERLDWLAKYREVTS